MDRILPSFVTSLLAWQVIGLLPGGGPTGPIGLELLRVGMFGVIGMNLFQDGLQLWLFTLSLLPKTSRVHYEPEGVTQ